jgi:hypothetical protein
VSRRLCGITAYHSQQCQLDGGSTSSRNELLRGHTCQYLATLKDNYRVGVGISNGRDILTESPARSAAGLIIAASFWRALAVPSGPSQDATVTLFVVTVLGYDPQGRCPQLNFLTE